MPTPVLILGAGPAGLVAAHELRRAGRSSTVLEASPRVGGLSGTLCWKGYRFDIGGHRFFTRYPRVKALWEEVLGDDLLVRPRLSRILYDGKLYHYPLRPMEALGNLGLVESARCVASFGRARLWPRGDEASFEAWVSNRFGARLFDTFFRTYTEKVWGIPCAEISADWAAQRIKNLSLRKAILGDPNVTSLIDQFQYPRLGPGMLYDRMAGRLDVRLRAKVTRVFRDDLRVTGVEAGGQVYTADHFLSSIPLTELVSAMEPAAPAEVLAATRALTFRHLVVACFIVEGAALFPDTWVYVHTPRLRVGRIQNQGNWSPEMVPEAGRSGISLEYFTDDRDPLWTSPDEEILALARRELAASGLCAPRVVDGRVIRAPRAYPVYRAGYEQHVATIREWLDRLDNLQAMGRYGMFKYNNADHSAWTAMLCVENLAGAAHDVWAVNADEQFQEG